MNEQLTKKANANVATLVAYLRERGLLGESIRDVLRDYQSEEEEVVYNAALAAEDLARQMAAVLN